MARHSFKLQIRPGLEAEYIRRHEAVYPDLLAAFKDVGIHTYSIFMDGLTLYAYMEVDDYQAAMAALATHPANIRWQTFMSDILIADENGNTAHDLPEVFHFSL